MSRTHFLQFYAWKYYVHGYTMYIVMHMVILGTTRQVNFDPGTSLPSVAVSTRVFVTPKREGGREVSNDWRGDWSGRTGPSDPLRPASVYQSLVRLSVWIQRERGFDCNGLTCFCVLHVNKLKVYLLFTKKIPYRKRYKPCIKWDFFNKE